MGAVGKSVVEYEDEKRPTDDHSRTGRSTTKERHRAAREDHVFEKSGEKGRSKKERLNVLLKELFMAQILYGFIKRRSPRTDIEGLPRLDPLANRLSHRSCRIHSRLVIRKTPMPAHLSDVHA